MNVASAEGHRDLMHVGPYLVTFDEAGADIEHTSTCARYRVQAATAHNVISLISRRIFIINLAHDWLEKGVEAIFASSFSCIIWRNILSHLFCPAQER